VPKGNEALARIKINRLLEESGWRFEDSDLGPANITLESGVKYTDLGDDFESAVTSDGRRGSIDFLLLDKDKKPLVVLEAKRSGIEPLAAKEQARNYARNCGARFIILSNGNIHYFWDTKHRNPETIAYFIGFWMLIPLFILPIRLRTDYTFPNWLIRLYQRQQARRELKRINSPDDLLKL